MQIHIIVIVVLFITSFSANAGGKISSIKTAQLIQQLKLNTERYGVVGQSVQILKNNKLIYQGKYGFANKELSVPISDKHLFPSYSVTKLFTSVLVMKFVENGTIDVKKSIRFYLPYLPKHWHKITVEHTLNHTSGIPRYFDMAMENRRFLPNKKAVFLSLIDQPAHFKMGTKNSYNNTNFLLLSAILEAKTGKSYKELVAEVIINPFSPTFRASKLLQYSLAATIADKLAAVPPLVNTPNAPSGNPVKETIHFIASFSQKIPPAPSIQ